MIDTSIFSDETENFRIPAEPKQGEPFRVLLRLRQGQGFSVSLCLKRDGSESLLTLPFAGCRGGYEYYEAYVSGVRRRAEYFFLLQKAGEGRLAYGRDGLSEVPENGIAQAVPFAVIPDWPAPDWARGAVYYQIFPERFCNGDPSNDVRDGEQTDDMGLISRQAAWDEPVEPMDVNCFYGGDLKGILDKLDYIQDLGAEVLYLNPVFASPSSHKYNIVDYDRVDPHFGSNELLAELIGGAHRRGMRVVLDGVFNHCGAGHPWAAREGFVARKNGRPEYWWDNETLPKLNTDGCPELENELLKIARKWVMPPYSADGWRLDVAADLGHTPEGNHVFWEKFRREVKLANPDAVVFAEHYGDPSPWFSGREWDSVMNYDAFMEPISFFLTGMEKHGDRFEAELLGNGKAFFSRMRETMARFPRPALEAALNELDNHDHSRFLTRTNHMTGRLRELGTAAASENTEPFTLRQAFALQMTWPGAPGIYYGDEAGLSGFTDPDNRRPFPWHAIDTDIWDFCQSAVRVHKMSPVFSRGSLLPLIGEKDIIAYARFLGGEAALVLISTSDDEIPVDIDLALITGTAPRSVLRVLESSKTRYNVGKKVLPAPGGHLKLVTRPREAAVFMWRNEV